MKKTIACVLTATTLALVPLIFSTGCAGTQGKESTADYTRDKEISASIKTAFYGDPTVRGTQVDVLTLKGVVQLSGFVDSPEAKARAEQIARATPGVIEVHNNLLLPTGR